MTVEPSDTPQPQSFLRNLLPTLAFTLLCGIVGPIFVVVGLSTREQGSGWLMPVGVAITISDVVVALLIARSRTRSQRKLYHLRTRGRRARGHVLSFEQTGVRVNDQPLLKIRLRIEGDDLAPFEVESRTVVSEIHVPLLHTGELPVLVDPETREWEIDWGSARAGWTSAFSGPVRPVAPVAPVEERSAAQRLAELDELLRRDLVSREEYDATRARILGAL